MRRNINTVATLEIIIKLKSFNVFEFGIVWRYSGFTSYWTLRHFSGIQMYILSSHRAPLMKTLDWSVETLGHEQ